MLHSMDYHDTQLKLSSLTKDIRDLSTVWIRIIISFCCESLRVVPSEVQKFANVQSN